MLSVKFVVAVHGGPKSKIILVKFFVLFSLNISALTTIYGIMFKIRYRRSHSSVLAHRNDQLLIAANIKRESFKWLSKMGFSNCYKIALGRNKQLAKNHDREVIEWKEKIENGDLGTEYQVTAYKKC